MAEEDLYGNKRKYEQKIGNFDKWLIKPSLKTGSIGKRTYYCKNKANLKYFSKLCNIFAVKDLSYARRNKLLFVLLKVTHIIEKNLKDCTRDDINELVAYLHTVHKTYESKKDFIKDIKCLWRVLFPECDMHGRPDETITPYVVRHLSRKIDKSKKKNRNEKYTIEEFEKIIQFFDNNSKIQAFITAIHETFVRPQELCYIRLRDLEFYDNYGIAHISEHGKEGTKKIQFETLSYPYLLKWYQNHPLKHDSNSFLFINEGNKNRYSQLTNYAVNKHLKKACKILHIDKNITCYTLKRMGITFERMKGVPDKILIAKAGWTSAKQLSTYDLGTRNEALRMSLIQKGLIDPENENERGFSPKQRPCAYCKTINGHMEKLCKGCKRPLDRKKIAQMEKNNQLLLNNELFQRLNRFENLLSERFGERNVSNLSK